MSNPGVLIVEDDANLRQALLDTLQDGEHPVFSAASGPEALDILSDQDIGLVVSDLQMEPMDGHELLGVIRQRHPALPAVLMTAHGSIANAVDEIRHGAADYLVKPFETDALFDVVNKHLHQPPQDGQVIAVDTQSLRLLRIAERVAVTDVTVTLSGESGSGKEVYARHMHQHSKRAEQPFIAINCAAIPDNMLEAVLFGYEKGSFTGASNSHPGKFEQAQGGTLLLDEISEMDLGLQAKLLRVLQEKEVERIGGRSLIALDVRVLATTNRNLQDFVAAGKFREDLYYRLNVFPLRIPPLRERPDDILPLARAALQKHCVDGERVPELSDEAGRALMAHHWPGNVRELENLIQRSLILLQGSVIEHGDLVFEDSIGRLTDTHSNTGPSGLHDDLQHREFQLIADALQDANSNRRKVAETLGISPRTLRYKLAKMRAAGFFSEADASVTRQRGSSLTNGGLIQ